MVVVSVGVDGRPVGWELGLCHCHVEPVTWPLALRLPLFNHREQVCTGCGRTGPRVVVGLDQRYLIPDIADAVEVTVGVSCR